MALRAALTPLVIALTSGSADAFVQGSVLTGLSGRQAYNLRAISWELVNPQAGSLANNSEISFSITRRSKTAIPLISDTDVIWKKRLDFKVTTSGAITFISAGSEAIALQEIPLVEETLYAQLDSSSLGYAASVVLRLDVEVDTMSDIDRLNLIARSLT
jgi:hypothetical protein